MELIRRIVLLEDLISKKSPISLDGKTISLGNGSCLVVDTKEIILDNGVNIDFNWGKIDVESFDVNIFLKQTIDDIGIYKDAEYVDVPPDYTILQNYYANTLTGLTWTTPLPHNVVFTGPYTFDQTQIYRLRGANVSDYFYSGGTVTGLTNSSLNLAKTYIKIAPFQIGFNLNDNPTQYFTGVLSLTSGATEYIVNSGFTAGFNTGIKYVDYTTKRTIYDDTFGIERIIDKTSFSYQAPGWNINNISLSAITKEELDLGIVFPHEIFNDVFIDRGAISAEETQMRLSEVDTIDQIERYGNKFYNIKTQY